jgi:hypothetical protein
VSPLRRIVATLLRATPARQPGMEGVWLAFQPEAARLDVEIVHDFASLGPPRSLAATVGLGKVLRILRAARIAAPVERGRLVQEEEAARQLERAVGQRLLLDLAPRSRLRFVAWTDAGMETVDDVSDVLEGEDAILVYRRTHRLPVRVPRVHLVRRTTECVRWYQVLDIARAPAPAARPAARARLQRTEEALEEGQQPSGEAASAAKLP